MRKFCVGFAVGVVVITVDLQDMHHVAPTDIVVDSIFELLWEHQEGGGRVMPGAVEVRKSINA